LRVAVTTHPRWSRSAIFEPHQRGRGGEFHVTSVLGQGADGVVFGARGHDGVPVALKCLHDYRGEASQRFSQEAEVLRRLDHPNVVRLLAEEEDDRGPFLVLELLEGETLADRLRRTPTLPIPVVRQLAEGLLGALEAAHRLGIIHRDVKPANLFFHRTPGGEQVKLLDFGVAKADREGPPLTRAGDLLGTLVFMAPEQAVGEGADARADLYGVAACLFTALAGRPLFDGAPGEVLAAILSGRRPRLDEIRPDLPEALADAIESALDQNVDARPPTAAAFRAALLDYFPTERPSGVTRKAEAPPAGLELPAADPEDDATLIGTFADFAAAPGEGGPPSPALAPHAPHAAAPLVARPGLFARLMAWLRGLFRGNGP
jgi:serine/threonine-protein kinase